MLTDNGDGVVPHKGRTAGHHRIEHCSQGIEVGFIRYLTAHGLLRRHIGHRTHHHARLGQAGKVNRHCQTEVTYLSGAVGTEPDIAGFYIAVDTPLAGGILQAPADSLGNTDCLLDGQAALRGFFNQAFAITTGHDRNNDVGLSFMVPQIVDSNDVGLVAESPHDLGFPAEAEASTVIQFLGLYQSKGHIPVQYLIMDEVDLLLTPLSEELLDLIAAVDKGSGHGRRWWWCCLRCWLPQGMATPETELRFDGRQSHTTGRALRWHVCQKPRTAFYAERSVLEIISLTFW